MLQTTHKGLSGTALKTIALVLMLMDHIHYFFEFTGCIPEWFSMLARLSAPLFLFCTVEGFAHTHDRKRYFFRIWCIGAGMAAVQFFMIYAKAFRRGDGFYPQNAIFQDFVLLCVIWQGIDWVRAKKYGKGIAAIAAVVGWPYLFAAVLGMFPQLMQRPIVSTVLAFVITSPVPMWTSITDGGWSYLVGGVLLYLLRNHRKAQVAVWALYSFLWDFVLVYLQLRGQPGFPDVYHLLRMVWRGRRGADADLQRHARQRAQTAVLLVLPGPCLPAVWGVLPGVSPDCIKRRKMLWRIFLRLMMTQIFAHC